MEVLSGWPGSGDGSNKSLCVVIQKDKLSVNKGEKKMQHKKGIKHLIIEFHNSDIFLNYEPLKIDKYLKKNNFILKKTFKFPFTTWEDRIYLNKRFKNEHSRTSS